MAITVHEAGRRIALDEIRVPKTVRALDESHVQALAGSIKVQGILVPLCRHSHPRSRTPREGRGSNTRR